MDGGEVAGKDGQTEYWDGAKVKRYLAWSEALITEHIPQRKVYLEARKAVRCRSDQVLSEYDQDGDGGKFCP